MYMKLGRYKEAESAALAAYQGYVKNLGADNGDTRQVAEQLVGLYIAMGQPIKAQQWRVKARGQ